jgi:hypothetical protein
MVTWYEMEGRGGKKRTIMSIAAALCVLGLVSLVWLHDSREASAAAGVPVVANDTQPPAGDSLRLPASTGVPSAESVFMDAKYIAPEEPIAQF